MDRLDAKMYNTLKSALRQVKQVIEDDELVWGDYPVVVVDFHEWDATFFETDSAAEDYLQEKYADNWDEGPPDGEDEELIVYRFCDHQEKETYASIRKDYKLLWTINGQPIYRNRVNVLFEPHTVVSVHI